MESLLEQQRKTHEELERLERAIVEELFQKPKKHKGKVAQEYLVNELLDRTVSRSRFLLDLYKDEDGARKAELDLLAGPNEFSVFYDKLKQIKDYHRRYPNEAVEPMELEFMRANQERNFDAIKNQFSGEESLGRYLDMHLLHDQYLNLKQSLLKKEGKDPKEDLERVEYLNYLQNFDNFTHIPRASKSREFKRYLENLFEYVSSFLRRSQALFDSDKLINNAAAEFETAWARGVIPGWEHIPLDQLEDVNSFAELDDMDGKANDLFCIACQKQFAKDTVFKAHLDGKKHKKAAEELAAKGPALVGVASGGAAAAGGSGDLRATIAEARIRQQKEILEREKEIALLEAKIAAVAKYLAEVREATRSMVEQKQSRSADEMLEDFDDEDEEEEEIVSEDDSSDDEKIYNPLKFPKGPDGKPIPVWLYKLHGLSVEYECEICGNQTYRGRRAFERHFQEWRHAQGLRCLGIPNSKQFYEITKIKDATTLHEKLKAQEKTEKSKVDALEEFEDSQGNVLTKKTYEDLRRQGLL